MESPSIESNNLTRSVWSYIRVAAMSAPESMFAAMPRRQNEENKNKKQEAMVVRISLYTSVNCRIVECCQEDANMLCRIRVTASDSFAAGRFK